MSFDLGDLFKKGSIAEQILVWQVLGQLIQPFLNPLIQTIASRTWQVDPNVPIPADICAGLVNRGWMDMSKGISESSKSGLGEPQFRELVKSAGTGPTLAEALELLRRQAIELGEPGQPGHTFYGALKDAGVRDEWAAQLAQLAIIRPNKDEVMNALLEGQIEESEAHRLYLLAGGDPDWFQHDFDSRGSAPTPDMLGVLANRGIIGWDGTGPKSTSFQQGFLEGPWRNKWLEPMRKMMEYRPPPRTIVAMIHSGALTDDQALTLLRQYGLTAELAAAYVKDAHHTKAATAKELTQAQISQLYKDHKITEAQALDAIQKLGYSKANAELLLALANVQKADTHVTAAMNRVHTLYVGHKITHKAASDSLEKLKISASQAGELLALWDIEIAANVRQLTPAQIVAAWAAGVLTQLEAQTELEHLGYTPFDAWVLLSTNNKAPLPNRPDAGVGIGVNP